MTLLKKTKRPWNIKVTLKPTVTGSLGTIPKGWVKGLEDLKILKEREETIRTSALLISARILRKVLET